MHWEGRWAMMRRVLQMHSWSTNWRAEQQSKLGFGLVIVPGTTNGAQMFKLLSDAEQVVICSWHWITWLWRSTIASTTRETMDFIMLFISFNISAELMYICCDSIYNIIIIQGTLCMNNLIQSFHTQQSALPSHTHTYMYIDIYVYTT